MKRILFALLLAIVPLVPASAAQKIHHVALQVDQNDPAVMNLVLNNVTNMASDWDKRGQQSEIEVVAYGPGLHMLRADDSPVKERLRSIKSSMPNVTFSACNITKTGMEKAEGRTIEIVPEARIVPSGVVRLVELQEAGWTYIKP